MVVHGENLRTYRVLLVLLRVCPIRVGFRSHVYFPSLLTYLYDETVMEDIIADEVEAILYIAREISGMSFYLFITLMTRRCENDRSIQDPAFEGK